MGECIVVLCEEGDVVSSDKFLEIVSDEIRSLDLFKFRRGKSEMACAGGQVLCGGWQSILGSGGGSRPSPTGGCSSHFDCKSPGFVLQFLCLQLLLLPYVPSHRTDIALLISAHFLGCIQLLRPGFTLLGCCACGLLGGGATLLFGFLGRCLGGCGRCFSGS